MKTFTIKAPTQKQKAQKMTGKAKFWGENLRNITTGIVCLQMKFHPTLDVAAAIELARLRGSLACNSGGRSAVSVYIEGMTPRQHQKLASRVMLKIDAYRAQNA